MKGAIEIRVEEGAGVNAAMRQEWIESNGLGGWASGTVAGPATRRYHGLLIAALHPPVHRVMLLSRLDETLTVNGAHIPLGAVARKEGFEPATWRLPTHFERGLFPVFDYKLSGLHLRKTIAALHDENTTVVFYEVLEADEALQMDLRPMGVGRDCHWLVRRGNAEKPPARFDKDVLVLPYGDELPACCLYAPGAEFIPDPLWSEEVYFSVEAYRGSDHIEDLYSHGVLRKSLRPGDAWGIVISLNPEEQRDAAELLARERTRREALFEKLPIRDAVTEPLALAADQLIVRRGKDLCTILAGFHWFTDWGRDTMIALPGLCLTTGRTDDARRILKAFAGYVDQGMLPNCFPDADADPHYNTIDGTLWFFVAIYKYWQKTGDDTFVLGELRPILLDIINWHLRGTRYGIRMQEDGLLAGGGPDTQLTWMDVKVDGWVITSRHGKAVEINALWYNALCVMVAFSRSAGDDSNATHFQRLADRARASFEPTFWNESAACLFDTANESGKDPAIRPNQIFAVSLPFPLLDGERAAAVVSAVERELLTSKGLRSLAPGHRDYKGTYGGPVQERDRAYHQGTVWSWLLGHYLTALVRVRGEAGRVQGEKLLQEAMRHLAEGGIGTVAEIFDADPPHAPRGCIAQAWGIAEWLRAYIEDVQGP